MNESGLSALDRPNSYIGKTVPRPNAKRLLAGRGTFVDDVKLPRMVHLAFLRSPYAHAKIGAIDTSQAAAVKGVVAVITGKDLEAHCAPWVGVLSHLAGLKSAPQCAIAIEKASWQGEAVAAVAATSRAIAEDAAALIDVDYEELPAALDMETALDPGTPVIHPELGDNLTWTREVVGGDIEAGLSSATHVVEETFRFSRHTGVTLEPRGLVADFDPIEAKMIVHHSGQAPHMMQSIFAKHVDLPEADVRVICKDIGGSFGIKVHTYGDEMATVAIAKMLGRPVKYIADRIESFTADIHSRDHIVTARMGIDNDGKIVGYELDDLTGVGPFSMYPRTSAIEANQVISLSGGQYDFENYRAKATVVYQNKAMMCQYRAVGHPIATAVSEGMADLAAEAAGLDPIEFRRRNLVADDAYPRASAAGAPMSDLSHHACLEKLTGMIDYDALKADRDAARAQGKYRGIGFASFIEVGSPSPLFYGQGGARISAQDGATLRLEPQGTVTVAIGVTEQGQGTEGIIAQIAATAVGVAVEDVRVITGDTDNSPYGGGTWGSRGAGIGGEAAWQAGKALRHNILDVAGAVLQTEPDSLDISGGVVVDKAGGAERVTLADLGAQVHFRTSELPNDLQPELVATQHYRVKGVPFVLTNGIQASYLEIDIETGLVTLLRHWVVEDCGTVINPQLVDEQIRGGVVQGIGGVLFEECLYDDDGNYLTASMADYLVPMAAEMPDIEVGHVETPTSHSELGAKGAGEAGTGGAPAAIMNAVNDALKPTGARITTHPITPQRILTALGTV
jgi:carbon-monoxide dehydrogenase large subunit